MAIHTINKKIDFMSRAFTLPAFSLLLLLYLKANILSSLSKLSEAVG